MCKNWNKLTVIKSFCVTLQIYASEGGGTHKPPAELVNKHIQSWGSGNEVRTALINSSGEVCVCKCEFDNEVNEFERLANMLMEELYSI